MLEKLRDYAELVKIEHTLFALPFALLGMFLAVRGFPPLDKLFWVVVGFSGARSGAMSFNRWVDAEFDALNPRTRMRPIQRGRVKKHEALLFSLVSYSVFVFSAWMLGDLCFKLSFLAVFILSFYSFTKRFTSLSHFILGLCLAASPVGAWIAMRNSVDMGILVVGLGVLFWVAGFDILYSLLDVEFDRKMGLFSIPSRIGIGPSIALSRLCHMFFFGSLIFAGLYFDLGNVYWAGCFAILIFLIYEHSLVRKDDLSKVNTAFFTLNASISIFILISVIIDSIVKG